MNNIRKRNYTIDEICILAGQIMLESGAETYRVEDTMNRIAKSFGAEYVESYVTPTAIVFSIDGDEITNTKMKRIEKRGTDLNKITVVNSLSREISEGKWTLQEAYQKLIEVQRAPFVYSYWLQILAATIVSGCFVIMFRGSWVDFIPGMVTGGFGYLCFLIIDRIVRVRFFSEFITSAIIGICALLLVYNGFGMEVDKIIIGSVMPLVPGLVITNAIRDLISGHLVSGITKGAEALLTAMAIGSGIAIIIGLF